MYYDLISKFNVGCLLLLVIYKGVTIFKWSIKDRVLIFEILDRSVNWLCGGIKD